MKPTKAINCFNFQHHQVRIVFDEQHNPLFVAKDVAQALGYGNTRDAIQRHCKGVVKHDTLFTDGGEQQVRVIYEPDVYRLIFGSKLSSAIEFQNWVFEQVLPQIRQTGQYRTANIQPSPQDWQRYSQTLTIPEMSILTGLHQQQVIQHLAQLSATPILLDERTSSILQQFWQCLANINLHHYNHSMQPQVLAINLPQLYHDYGVHLPYKGLLIKALRQCPQLRQENHPIRSAIHQQVIKCWLFDYPQ